jgi:hypothetical protein
MQAVVAGPGALVRVTGGSHAPTRPPVTAGGRARKALDIHMQQVPGSLALVAPDPSSDAVDLGGQVASKPAQHAVDRRARHTERVGDAVQPTASGKPQLPDAADQPVGACPRHTVRARAAVGEPGLSLPPEAA